MKCRVIRLMVMKMILPGATPGMMGLAYFSTHTPPQPNRVPPPTPASASLHPTATARMATHSTMQLACAVGRVGALPIPVCSVPAHHHSAVPFCNALTLAVVYLTPKHARVSKKIARPKTVLSAMPKHNHVREEIAMVML